MNNNQTIEKLRNMRLSGMVQIHENHIKNNVYADYTLDEYAALLCDTERDHQDKPLYKNRSAATVKLITEYLRHHETGPNSPFAPK